MKQSKRPKKQRRELIRIAEYFVSGGAYFWTGYFLIVVLEPVIGLWWANLIGNGVGITVNFLLQRYWVFRDRRHAHAVKSVSARYIIITAINFILNYFILLGLKNIGIGVEIGQFIASGFFTVWNYLWYRFWVFPEPHNKKGRA